MPTVSRIIPNTYRDSVALMQLSASLKTLPGIEEVSAIVATAGNLALLREVGLLDGEQSAALAVDFAGSADVVGAQAQETQAG